MSRNAPSKTKADERGLSNFHLLFNVAEYRPFEYTAHPGMTSQDLLLHKFIYASGLVASELDRCRRLVR